MQEPVNSNATKGWMVFCSSKHHRAEYMQPPRSLLLIGHPPTGVGEFHPS